MPIVRKLFDCFNKKGEVVVPFSELRGAVAEALASEWDSTEIPNWLKELELWLCEYDRGDRTEKEVLALWHEANAEGNKKLNQQRREAGLDVPY